MTTLPPEGNEQSDGTPNEVPQTPTDTPDQTFGAPETPLGESPAAGESAGSIPPPPAPPASPGYGAPQQPGYSAPPQPGYSAPPPGYSAPPPGYYQPQQPQQPPYFQGQQQYQQQYPQGQQPQNPLQNLTANYWLSVFFFWIPALIFFLVESPRASPQVRALHAANLNFSLLRTALLLFGWVLFIIPGIGSLVLTLAHIAGFVLHIIAATKVTETYQRGGTDPFLFNAPMVK